MKRVVVGVGVLAVVVGLCLALLPVPEVASRAMAAASASDPAASSTRTAAAPVRSQAHALPPVPVTLSPAVVRAIKDKSWRPKPAEVPPLDSEMEELVVNEYRSTRVFTNKVSLILVLAYGGSESVVPLLADAITNEFSGQAFAESETDTYAGLLHVMGYVAKKHPEAYQFLEAACEPAFWEGRTLPSTAGDVSLKEALVQCALLGLAASGRPQAMRFFEEVRSRSPEAWPVEYRSLVVDAVYRYRLLKEHGDRYSSGEAFPNGESLMRAFLEWLATPEGTEWSAWSDPNNWPHSTRNR